MIKSDNKWYEIIWYVHNKTMYSHIYTTNYDIRVQMILTNHVLIHICDDN